MLVPSIVNVVSQPVYISRPTPNDEFIPAQYRYGYTYSLTAPVSTQVEFFSGTEVDRYKTPDAGGLLWKDVMRGRRIKMTPYTHRSSSKVRQLVYLNKVQSSLQVARNDPLTAQNYGIASQSWGEILPYTEEVLSACNRLNDTVLDQTMDSYVRDVRNELYEKSSVTFDALTEFAELREGIAFVHSLFRIRGNALVELWRKAARDGLDLTDAASVWMAYRYALMPLMYTYNDIKEVLDKVSKAPIFLTYRANRSISSGPLHATPPFGYYAYQRGSVKVRGVVKKKYDAGATAQLLLDMIGVNPIRTAWELTTLSWLLDWFINLGNVLSSFTSLDLATETACCISVKCDYSTEYFYRDVYDVVIKWPSASLVNPGKEHSRIHYDQVYPIASDVINSYTRTLHDVNDVPFAVGVSDTWKHWIDALALSSRELTKILRSL